MSETSPGFDSFDLSAALQDAIAVAGFSTPTPVQAQTLPLALEGKDVIAQARTGSGKTAAFALPLLQQLEPVVGDAVTRALVLCPTRELADQVTTAMRQLAARIPNVKVVALCGGVPAREQTPSLARAPHIIVGTPGRVLDHLERGNLDMNGLQTLVLDEADRMLDMGFESEVSEIANHLPQRRQTLLFSATVSDGVRRLSRRYQNRAVSVEVDHAQAPDAVTEEFFDVNPAEKIEAVEALLAHHQPDRALIFCVTKNDTDTVCRALLDRGFAAAALHGDMDQRARDDVFAQFSNHSRTVLVATDVACRGLDVKELPVVISFELPTKADVHLHRIGRTGRAGHPGLALHLCAPQERRRAQNLEDHRDTKLTWDRLPMLQPGFKPPQSEWTTLVVNGGRKDKLRPGDILGALTQAAGLDAGSVGAIKILPQRTYVAVAAKVASAALAGLSEHKIKKRKFRVSLVR